MISETIGRNVSLDIFAGLIHEVLPADNVIWKTTAQQGRIWWGYSDRVACYIDNQL